MLKQRILTALVLAPLALWGIWASPLPVFAAILAVIFALAGWEWARLSGLAGVSGRIAYVALLLLGMAGLYFGLTVDNLALAVFVLALVWWSMALMMVLSFPQGSEMWRRSGLARGIAGLFILLPAWLALVVLHGQVEDGPGWVILLVMLVWAADTGAYFAGRALGRHKLAPKVSPGKTWEGAAGGLLLALLIALLGSLWLSPGGGMVAFVVLVLLTIAISVLGDLVESLFKRITDIKDSGGLLPGHGGMLDRIDSLTAAAPLFVLGMVWLG